MNAPSRFLKSLNDCRRPVLLRVRVTSQEHVTVLGPLVSLVEALTGYTSMLPSEDVLRARVLLLAVMSVLLARLDLALAFSPRTLMTMARPDADMRTSSTLVTRHDIMQRHSAWASVFAGVALLGPRVVGASGEDSSVRAVVLVRDSCQQLEDDLTNGRYPDIRAVTKSLLKNYRLKDALAESVKVATNRDEALTHSRSALEYLYSIIEYYEEPLGPSGNALPGSAFLKPATLQFTVNALQAARKEFDLFLNVLPPSLVHAAKETDAPLT